MPRTARKKSKTGIYHVILRGINRQTIFECEEDALKFIQTLGKYLKDGGYSLYAYCLMGNHIHLLMKEEKEDLGTSIKRIGASYVYWYNWKYERIGHLFQDRYKSEKVENGKYFLAVLRYIHQNPFKAGLVKELADYPWSSFNEYIGESKLIDTNFVLNMFSNDRSKAIDAFKKFHAVEGQETFLDIDEKKKWKDSDAIELIKSICHVTSCKEVQKLDKKEQSHYFKLLYQEGLSARQIARITGIGRWMVLKAINN
ncbi:transposase [Desulfoscipio gibsoniae]|uniref:Transposase n=1 Tax=Desulfoscipio gibsoniae DSM 7213 TaxID=767817 RepID=R4KGF4_9FIRM|nr:transposase [Desulfoscipio gibsoniae]AGL01679.1 transposase [Desulfoscipio gibsoniae DSM 7213]